MVAPVFVTGNVPTADQVNVWFVNTKFAYKTANLSRASTTVVADDPDLQLTVAANSVYLMTGVVKHLSQATVDLSVKWSAPAGASFDWSASTVALTGTGSADDVVYAGSIIDNPGFGGIAGVNVPIFVSGMLITTGTAGSLKLQWAQVVSSASSSTVLSGSFIDLRRVG